ncbi:MAG: PadR family transcriptional regulator [Bacillaceae bacterium]
MDQRALLILGILKKQNAHGYQLFEFIENILGKVGEMKKATAYAILKRLHKDGYVDFEMLQEGNRPVRQVYSITAKGEELFLTLLKEELKKRENMTPTGEIGIMFLDYLPIDECIILLEEKVEKIKALLTFYTQVPSHEGIGVNLAMSHRRTLLEAEINWYENMIKELKAKQD